VLQTPLSGRRMSDCFPSVSADVRDFGVFYWDVKFHVFLFFLLIALFLPIEVCMKRMRYPGTVVILMA